MKKEYGRWKKLLTWLLLTAMLVLPLAAVRPQKAFAYDGTLYKYTVKVKKNYLALRRGKAFKAENEIGKLYTGDTVIHCPIEAENSTYWYVYSPKHHKLGFVNCNYLEFDEEYTGDIHYTAYVEKNYLALRKAPAYDASNEKGRLYSGDDVIVLHKSDSDYWIVYSEDLEMAGYTNKHYLYRDYDEDDYDDDDEDYDYEDDEGYYTMSETNKLSFRSGK